VRWGRVSPLAFLLPAVIYLLLSRILPALHTVYLSFTSYNLAYDDSPRWSGLANYARLIRDSELLSSLTVTMEFTCIATVAELLLGLLAALLFDHDMPARNILLGVFLIPMVMPPVVVGTIWYILFNQFVGPIPYLLRLAHGPEIAWMNTPGTALFALIVADLWEWVPLMALLILSALQAIPKELVEAATVDGASGFKLFRYITLPQIAGMLAVAAGLRFMDAFRELDKVIIMTGGGPGTATDFLSMHVYKSAFKFFTLGYAAAIVVVILLFLAFMYTFFLRVLRSSAVPE
jgi:multiple sugar transport system permease protein